MFHSGSSGWLLHLAALAALISFLVPSNRGCSTELSTTGGNGKQKPASSEMQEFERLRERMVRQQLQARDIKDPRVLAAMMKVPRHLFVPRSIIDSSYDDTALPIGLGQTISQPYIVAYMTKALALRGSERVLEIGTGSGYQAAVLAEIVPEVYTIEIVPELATRAKSLLESLGYTKVRFLAGDGYQGWPEHAPFDCIMVTAAPDHVPQPLVDQLKPGGRMIIPVGQGEQELILIQKSRSGITRRSTIPVRFVPMTGKALQTPPR